MAEMEVIEPLGTIRRVLLKGRLDTEGVGRLEIRFNATLCPNPKPTILDFKDVTFVSSMGIRMLVSAARTMAKRGASLVILAPQPLVRESLVSASIDDLFPLVDSEAEAARVLAGA